MLFSSSMMISSVELTSKASKQPRSNAYGWMGKVTLPLMTPPLIKLKHNPRTIEKGTCAKAIRMISCKIQCHLPQKCLKSFLTTSGSSNWRQASVQPKISQGFSSGGLHTLVFLYITWPGHIFGREESPRSKPHGSVVKFYPVKRSARKKRGPKNVSPLFFRIPNQET